MVSYMHRTLAALNGGDGTQKTINTQMHLLEAVTLYYRVNQDSRARGVLEQVLEPLTTTVVDPRHGFVAELLDRDWTPTQPLDTNTVSFGHVNELTWLLIDTCEVRGSACGGLTT